MMEKHVNQSVKKYCLVKKFLVKIVFGFHHKLGF